MDQKLLNGKYCAYGCKYYQDGAVLSLCNKFKDQLKYADNGKPQACEKCLKEIENKQKETLTHEKVTPEFRPLPPNAEEINKIREDMAQNPEFKEKMEKMSDKETQLYISEKIIENLGKNYTAKTIGFTIVLKKWRRDVR